MIALVLGRGAEDQALFVLCEGGWRQIRNDLLLLGLRGSLLLIDEPL